MPEPISSGTAASTVTGLAVLSLLPGLDADVVMGAFAGALIWICTTEELGILRRLALFVAAFMVGLHGAGFCAALLGTITPESLAVPRAVGALVASAITVRLLQFVLRKSPDDLLNLLRRRG
ncbi:phage holin family protein [Aeromonas veronii]